jgi:hypothetical protein
VVKVFDGKVSYRSESTLGPSVAVDAEDHSHFTVYGLDLPIGTPVKITVEVDWIDRLPKK